MAEKLTKLPKTQYSGLDYQNIIEDIISLVTENPEYNQQYDDFLSSNAGRMMTEMFAHIADQLATRIDWVVNENYIGTATQKSSVIKILKLLGYNFDLPIASNVEVTMKINQPVGEFYLTPPYDNSGEISPYTLNAEDRNGIMKIYEALNFNEENGTYDYRGGVKIQTGTSINPNLTHYVQFYEGKTFIEERTADTDNNPIFTISKAPVIEGSVQVYLVYEEGGLVKEERLNEVNSFLDPEAQNEQDEFGNDLPLAYKLNIEENNTVTVEFPPTTLIPDINRRLRADDTVRIFYRTGGGVDGNVTARSINVTKTLAINGSSVDINFMNESKGTGGRDAETAEHAAVYAPLSIRTAEKTVTEEDYNIIVNGLNTVVKAQSFGNNNIAPSTVYAKYGMYIHPLEVWHFILKDKPGWEDVLPSRYKDFQWVTLRLENRFNEVHSFRDGEYGHEVLFYSSDMKWETTISSDTEGSDKTFYNYQIIETPDKFKENLFEQGIDEDNDTHTPNSNLVLKITEKDVETYFFKYLSTYNEFYELDTTNNGLIEGATPTWSVRQIVPAKLKSEVDLSNGIDLSSRYMLTIGADNNPLISDIDVRGSSPDETSVQEIVDNINNAFTSHADYNNGESGSKGYQELGLSVDATTNAGLNNDYTYSIYINGYEKTITTGTDSTYNDLRDLLQESLNFKLIADISSQSNTLANFQYDIELVEPGMSVSGYSIPDGTVVTNVSIPDNEVKLSNAAEQTANNEEITFNGYSVTVEGSSPSQDIRISNIGCYPKHSVRLEPGISYDDLLTGLSTTPEIPEPGSGKVGHQYTGLSVDLSTTSPLSNGTVYYFKINDYEYSITTGTDDTYNDIIILLDTVLDPNYTVSASGSTGSDDIVFTNDTNASVFLEAGESGNDLFEGLHGTSDYTFGSFEGGGDYSNVAKITTYVLINYEVYVEVRSPNKGDVSFITFGDTTDSSLNATEDIFVINVGGDYPSERVMRGTRALTIITDELSDNFGNIIFENGSINLTWEQTSFFINYLIDDKGTLDIGKYYNENFPEDDPSWRIVADRIYNTVYDKDRDTVDLNKSNFYVKFTKDNIDESSIYVVNNTWLLNESENTIVETVENPQDNINENNYFLSIKFDDKPIVENIDITGDDYSGSSYLIGELITNINTAIRNTSGYDDDLLYADYDFARSNEAGNKIIFKSPLNNNVSKIELHPSTVSDCVNELFGLIEGEIHEYFPEGDYFIDYDKSRDIMTLNELTSSGKNMPDLNFYFHFIFDKRVEEEIYDGEEGRPGFAYGTLDEDIYEADLSTYKITGLNHVYKETQFNTFDVKGTIYYNKIYSAEDVQNRVEETLRERFNLENIDYGEPIPKSRILSIIHESVGVEYAILDYLGPDAQKPGTAVENTVESGFNEIILLSEDIFDAGQKIHGILFEYLISR